jgi:hypothetical protein
MCHPQSGKASLVSAVILFDAAIIHAKDCAIEVSAIARSRQARLNQHSDYGNDFPAKQ